VHYCRRLSIIAGDAWARLLVTCGQYSPATDTRVSRQPSPLGAQRHEGLLRRLQALTAEPPVWGSRRIWAYLHCIEQWAGNQQRILRLMRAHHLLVPPNVQLKAKRTPRGSTPQPPTPNAWWGLARTKVLGHGVGGVSSVVVLEW
jgi:HTH-like domain